MINKLTARYYFVNGDTIDFLDYKVCSKLFLIDLLMSAREDSDFVKLEIMVRK